MHPTLTVWDSIYFISLSQSRRILICQVKRIISLLLGDAINPLRSASVLSVNMFEGGRKQDGRQAGGCRAWRGRGKVVEDLKAELGG